METNPETSAVSPNPIASAHSCYGRAIVSVHHDMIWAQNLPAMKIWPILIGIMERQKTLNTFTFQNAATL